MNFEASKSRVLFAHESLLKLVDFQQSLISVLIMFLKHVSLLIMKVER